MIAQVVGPRIIKIRMSDGSLRGQIHCDKGEVSTAYISGDEVNVQLKDGSVVIYKINGTIVRHIRR